MAIQDILIIHLAISSIQFFLAVLCFYREKQLVCSRFVRFIHQHHRLHSSVSALVFISQKHVGDIIWMLNRSLLGVTFSVVANLLLRAIAEAVDLRQPQFASIVICQQLLVVISKVICTPARFHVLFMVHWCLGG